MPRYDQVPASPLPDPSRRSRRGLLLGSLLLAAVCGRAAGAVDAPSREALEGAVAAVDPALVRLEVVWADHVDGRELRRELSGSGFVVDPRGYVVTNHHVAGHAVRAVCVFPDNEELDATLVGTDPMTDISVLKLSGDGRRGFPVVRWGDSDRVSVGDAVLALGSPMSLSQSVTHGIVGNLRMTMPKRFRRFGTMSLEGEDVGSLVRWIGHDAAIHPGNSGGPLVNLSGEVIGVNEIEFGLAGAIPGNLARGVAERLIGEGGVSRSWLGLALQPLLKSSGLTRGALVSGVYAGSPAERAGFRSGDILLELDGQETAVRFEEDLPPLNLRIAALPIGDEVRAVVLRGGRRMPLAVRPSRLEPADSRETESRPWGMDMKDISLMTAQELRLADRDGVLVTSVRPGGACSQAKPGLEPRDVIKSAAGRPVKNVAELLSVTRDLTKDKSAPTATLVEFTRRGERLLSVVKVGTREPEDPGLEATKAWLPVAVQVVSPELARQLGDGALSGVRVTQVYRKGTAEAAGLRVGDVIVSVDGEKLQSSQPGDEESFFGLLRRYRVGDRPEFSFLRGGVPMKAAIELVGSPRLGREMKRFQDLAFDFTARDLSFFDRVRESLPEDADGALVVDVTGGGWAAIGGLEVNDIVRSVDGEAVADVAALKARMGSVAERRPKRVVLSVRRGIRTRFLELEPDWEDGKSSAAGGHR